MAQVLVESHDVALMDLDGVAYEGAKPIAYAAEGMAAAKALGVRTQYVTNNASRNPQSVAAQLTEHGIPTPPEEIFTSAMAAVILAERRHGAGATVLGIGGEGLFTAIAESSLSQVESADDRPTVIIQGLSKTLGWPELTEATLAISFGADFIATNMDSTLPTERGPVLGNGSLVAAVVYATGVQPADAGKPGPLIFELASQRAHAASPIAVGDRLGTDIRGAVASGIPSLHVLTGISTAREVVTAPIEQRPTYLGLDLRDLSLPYPDIAGNDGVWTCSGATAEFREGVLYVSGRPLAADSAIVSLDEYRALTHAAWNRPDGAPLSCPELEVRR